MVVKYNFLKKILINEEIDIKLTPQLMLIFFSSLEADPTAYKAAKKMT